MLTISTSDRRLPFDAYLAHGTAAGLHWTSRREDVLRCFWEAELPLGAYELADQLGGGERVHPPTVYRCLRSLEEAGLVLPILALKKHVLSPDPGIRSWGLLVCRGCRACKPIDLTPERDNLDHRLRACGYEPRTCWAEAHGHCGGCQEPEERR